MLAGIKLFSSAAEVLSLLESDVEEAIGRLHAFVDVLHLGVTGEYLFVVDEESDGRLLAQLHALADDCVELNCLEVIGDQEPRETQGNKG